MADMRMFVGTPYERGLGEAISSRKNPAPVGEGLVVCLTAEDTIGAMAAGKIPYGVTGKVEIGATDVVQRGLKVFAQTSEAAGSTALPIGGVCSVDPATGKIVPAGTSGAIDLNAIVRTAVVGCKNSKGEDMVGVGLDFIGGL